MGNQRNIMTAYEEIKCGIYSKVAIVLNIPVCEQIQSNIRQYISYYAALKKITLSIFVCYVRTTMPTAVPCGIGYVNSSTCCW